MATKLILNEDIDSAKRGFVTSSTGVATKTTTKTPVKDDGGLISKLGSKLNLTNSALKTVTASEPKAEVITPTSGPASKPTASTLPVSITDTLVPSKPAEIPATPVPNKPVDMPTSSDPIIGSKDAIDALLNSPAANNNTSKTQKYQTIGGNEFSTYGPLGRYGFGYNEDGTSRTAPDPADMPEQVGIGQTSATAPGSVFIPELADTTTEEPSAPAEKKSSAGTIAAVVAVIAIIIASFFMFR